jgi:glycerophosphoryl diester phosphodiesterase
VDATWSVWDSTVATLDSNHVLRALTFGSTTLVGSYGDKSVTATVNVGLDADTAISLIAHRGYAGVSPENTLIAFGRALDLGADGIEMDVQLTKDSVPVIMHDVTVDRTTNGTGVVNDMTLEQIRQLDDCARTTWSPCKVPLLEEVFALAKGRRGRLLVDLKGKYTEQTIRILVDHVLRSGLRRKVMFTSFDVQQLRWIRQIDPVVHVGILSSTRVEPTLAAEIAPVVLLYDVAFLDTASALAAHVAQAKTLGVDVGAWTVRTSQTAQSALAAARQGVLRVISDFPLDRSVNRFRGLP